MNKGKLSLDHYGNLLQFKRLLIVNGRNAVVLFSMDTMIQLVRLVCKL